MSIRGMRSTIRPHAVRDGAYAGGVPLLRYSLLRALILLASLAALFLVGMRGWWWLLASVVVAALLSYLVLPRQRIEAAEAIAARAERAKEGRSRQTAGTDRAARTSRTAGQGDDEEVEDAMLDAAAASEPDRGRSAPPQPERERGGDHELEASDVAQHGDEVESPRAVTDDAGDREGDRQARQHEKRGEG